jgi:hypothetical protein
MSVNMSDVEIIETLLTGVAPYEEGTKNFKEFEWNHEADPTLTI